MTVSPVGQRQPAEKVFLETTIQIDRFWETAERRIQIQENLVGKEICTSSYVRMELQRTIIQDLTYVLSCVQSDCEAPEARTFLSDLARRLSKRSGSHGARSVARAHFIVALILEEFGQNEIPRSELVAYLLDQIASYRRNFLLVDLSREEGRIVKMACSNSTDCDLIRDDRAVARWFRCRREEATCRLDEFLSEHAEKLAAVGEAFKALGVRKGKEQERKTARALGQILGQKPVDWHAAKGQRNCWPVGDTIIALETPEDAFIYTTDQHYKVICPIVGRRLFQEKPGALGGRRGGRG